VIGFLGAAFDGDAADVVPAGRFAIGGVDDAGEQAQHADVVAALERHFFQLFLGDQARPFGALRLDAGGFGGDGDGLRDLAEVQGDRPQGDALVGGEVDVRLFVGLEVDHAQRD